MAQIITCNNNCICDDVDCSYKHYLSYKERKIVKKFYCTLKNVNKEETNMESRKKNCSYGQLCNNKKCGFKHRLNYENREQLIVLYNYNKICPEKKEIKSKEQIIEDKSIVSNNYFLFLDDEINEDKIKEEITVIPVELPVYKGKSWLDIVINKNEITPVLSTNLSQILKPTINMTIDNSSWEELADEDFYMMF